MASQNVCRYYKFGHCKFADKCRQFHVSEECENSYCDIISFNLRHPRPCNFFRDYKRCKFSEWCSYKHIENNDSNEVSYKEMLEKLANLSENIIKRNEKINKFAEKIEILENKTNKKDEEIRKLTDRLKVLEESIGKIDTHNEVHEKEDKETDKEIYKCENCSFETVHKNDLKIQIKRKHAKAARICDLCGQQFETVREMKIHRNTHSFSGKLFGSRFECEECDFVSETLETMEVHNGKCCYDHFECGLCECRFDTLEMLELHLVTCEVYECGSCFIRVKNLSEMKKHVKTEHKDGKYLHHLKIDRTDNKKISFTQVSIDKV